MGSEDPPQGQNGRLKSWGEANTSQGCLGCRVHVKSEEYQGKEPMRGEADFSF